jgi:ABC-2 family transporter protein
MMKDKVNFKVMAPIVAILITFAVSLVILPVIKGEAKDLPISVVSLDQGMTTPQGDMNLGTQIAAGMTAKINAAMADKDPAPLKLVEIADQAKLDQAFEDRDIYAAIVIPADFTAQKLTGGSPVIKVIIDEGQSKAVATVLSTMIASMSGESEVPLTIEYKNPIGSDMANGNANMFAFIMAWIAALVCSIVLSKAFQMGLDQSVASKLKLLLMAALTAVVIAACVSFILKFEFGLGIEFGITFGFLSIAVFCLMMLIIGVMSWSFIGGVVIFVTLMLLGLVASNLPYEILPTFWQDYVYPWIPMRFMSDGIKEIFYMNGGIWNAGTQVLTGFGATGILLTLLSVLKKEKAEKIIS